jgi:hypothetical protein
MSTEEFMKNAKDGVAVIGEVIKAAGNNPQVKEAGQELGKTALTVTKAINNVFLPLAALNFGIDKARKYFAEKFPGDMAQKAARIPPEAVVEPKASVVGPALQGLAFSHEEEDLKEMYLNLLASAMDTRVAESAHPAFVEIIKQINAKEAKLLQFVLGTNTAFMIGKIYTTPDINKLLHATTNTLYLHLLDLRDEKGLPAEDPFLPAMVDNWIRLRLISVDYDLTLTNQDYSWIETRPEFIFQRDKVTTGEAITYNKGIMRATAWGMQFAKAVGLADAGALEPKK